MNEANPSLAPAARWANFGTSIFAEMTQLATRHQAINLSQGFPDFEGPAEIIEAAVTALRSGHNQYARSMGVVPLAEAVAAHQADCYGLSPDPGTEVVITCGATEAIAASLVGLLNPGDEVILFEPFYDSYPAMAALAGAAVRCVPLRFPDFALDLDALERAVGPRTRGLVLNNPHNPSGKVFSRAELSDIAAFARRHRLWVVADEVYEHLTYDQRRHIPIATLPGMWERTLTLSSTGKTFSMTGWKVGWASGPASLVQAVQAAHQFLTFSGATPLQMAMAQALERYRDPFFEELRQAYTERRDLLADGLRQAGFEVARPQGTYFILAALPPGYPGNDRDLAHRLVTEAGVAAVPPSSFYRTAPEEGARLLRFAFCKQKSTLAEAVDRLIRWHNQSSWR